MKTINSSMEYVAPEIEVVSTVVEYGFSVSGDGLIDNATEEDYGGF